MDARIWSMTYWVELTEPVALKALYDGLLKQAGFNILSFSENYFPGGGWTGMWLLGESHLAIHTFPEHGKTYIELSSCVKDKFDKFVYELISGEIE